MTKNVPCFKRCKQIMSDFSSGKGDHMIKLTDDDDEGWVDTHHGLQDEHAAVTDMSMGSEDTDVGKKGIYLFSFSLNGSGGRFRIQI